ncbi:MAG: hypothetical protein KatS3mg011_1433 [Acidimicrobiia bacterium]|nr:MAG: hypothetical protein KatS3mg011_1433 [Acidimicrobiia bacterium]
MEKHRSSAVRRAARRVGLTVLLVGLISVWGWTEVRSLQLEEDRRRTAGLAADELEEAFAEGFARLEAATGLFLVEPYPTPEEFLSFTDHLELTRDPDSVAIARVALPNELDQVEAFVNGLYQEPVEFFSVGGGPIADTPLHAIVVYHRPGRGASPLIGFDAASEERRRRAIQRAMATQGPATSEPLTLVNGSTGVILVVPFVTESWRGVALGAADLATIVSDAVPASTLADYRIELTTETTPGDGVRFLAADRVFEVTASPRSEGFPLWVTAAALSVAAAAAAWAAYRLALVVFERRGLVTRAMLLEALNREKERKLELASLYELLAATSLDVIVLLERDGTIAYVSPSVRELLGYTPEELVGSPAAKVTDPADWERVAELLESWNTDTGIMRVRLVRKDGSRVWTEVAFKGASDGRARLGIRDVTHIVQLERSLEEKTRQAEAANQAKTLFLARITHDLKTPITAVLGMSELLLEQPLDAETREFVETIRRAADSMLDLVNQLLDLSRIESGRIGVETEPVDIADLIRYLTNGLQPVAEAKGLELSAEIAPEVPRVVETDPRHLERILSNLLSNGLKFTERGGVKIRVSTAEAGEGELLLRFDVEDTGIGIPPEAREAIFAEFGQTPEGQTRGGVGLGLFIARQLARLLGGDLTVDSRPGEGSVFTLTVRARVVEPVAVGDDSR